MKPSRSNRMERRIQSFKDKSSANEIGTTVSSERNWFGLHDIHFPSNKDIQVLSKALGGRKR